MLTRRAMLERALKGSSLIAAGPLVPGFLASAARAAEPGGDTVLVVLEMTGGNDGLNTVVPYADDLYHRARPKIGLAKEQVVRVDDHIGLNPGLRGLDKFLNAGQLAIIQGVGYPNPDRSHFDSMDIWQSGDPARNSGTGWLGRTLGHLGVAPGKVPGVHAGAEALPLALRGSASGVPTIHPSRPFDLDLVARPPSPNFRNGGISPFGGESRPLGGPRDDGPAAARRRLIADLAESSPAGDPMLQFVRRTSLQTYSAVEHLREVARSNAQGQPSGFQPGNPEGNALAQNLALVGQLIAAEFGTRLFYLSVSGFDTHANQVQAHQQLLQQVSGAIANFFAGLERSGHARRVVLMTFSEFGRRLQENGSQGTDHGAASCQFLVGPAVAGGVVGAHPSLAPDALDSGDLRHHTDFRRVYATLLDRWLGCDSHAVLGGAFEPLPILKSV